jgi:hypothetical protein
MVKGPIRKDELRSHATAFGCGSQFLVARSAARGFGHRPLPRAALNGATQVRCAARVCCDTSFALIEDCVKVFTECAVAADAWLNR